MRLRAARSASWSQPDQALTNDLIKLYNKLRDEGSESFV
jgi:hypothetical protein